MPAVLLPLLLPLLFPLLLAGGPELEPDSELPVECDAELEPEPECVLDPVPVRLPLVAMGLAPAAQAVYGGAQTLVVKSLGAPWRQAK